jgi:hypothetical protein
LVKVRNRIANLDKLLAQRNTGIKEVQIIQWFVQPGARVEQFDKLCEVQSDKAATEVLEAPSTAHANH